MSDTLLGSDPAPAPPANPAPADPPAGGTPPANPAPPAPAPDAWMQEFQGEDLGWLQNRGLTGKSAKEALSNLVQAQRNAEKRFGVPQDRLLQLPADPTSEGAMDAVWNALGRPENAEGYEIAGGDTDLSKSFATTLSSTFHKAGLSKDQAAAVYGAMEDFFSSTYDKEQEATATASQVSMQALQNEWGDTFDMNVALAREAVKAAGATKDEIDALEAAFGENGNAAVIRFFNRIGQKRGVETDFIDGDGRLLGLGATTPEAAKQRIGEMKADPAIAKDILANNPDNANVKKYRMLLALASKGGAQRPA